MGGKGDNNEPITGPYDKGCENMGNDDGKKPKKDSTMWILRMRIRDMMNGVGHCITKQNATKINELSPDDWKGIMAWIENGLMVWNNIYTENNFTLSTKNDKVANDLVDMMADLVPFTMTPTELKAHMKAQKAADKLSGELNAIMAKVTTGELTADAARKLITKL